MSQKGFAHPVLVVVIIVIASVVGFYVLTGYFAFKNTSNQMAQACKDTLAQDAGSIADWKTYTLPSLDEFGEPAPEIGFSFRYPSNILGVPILSFNRVVPENPSRRQITLSMVGGSLLIDITINARSYGGTIVPELENISSGTVVSADNRTLAYETGRYTAFIGGTIKVWYVGTRVNEDAHVVINGDVYSIRFSDNIDCDRTELVRQILSTFRFTN